MAYPERFKRQSPVKIHWRFTHCKMPKILDFRRATGKKQQQKKDTVTGPKRKG